MQHKDNTCIMNWYLGVAENIERWKVRLEPVFFYACPSVSLCLGGEWLPLRSLRCIAFTDYYRRIMIHQRLMQPQDMGASACAGLHARGKPCGCATNQADKRR